MQGRTASEEGVGGGVGGGVTGFVGAWHLFILPRGARPAQVFTFGG